MAPPQTSDTRRDRTRCPPSAHTLPPTHDGDGAPSRSWPAVGPSSRPGRAGALPPVQPASRAAAPTGVPPASSLRGCTSGSCVGRAQSCFPALWPGHDPPKSPMQTAPGFSAGGGPDLATLFSITFDITASNLDDHPFCSETSRVPIFLGLSMLLVLDPKLLEFLSTRQLRSES